MHDRLAKLLVCACVALLVLAPPAAVSAQDDCVLIDDDVTYEFNDASADGVLACLPLDGHNLVSVNVTSLVDALGSSPSPTAANDIEVCATTGIRDACAGLNSAAPVVFVCFNEYDSVLGITVRHNTTMPHAWNVTMSVTTELVQYSCPPWSEDVPPEDGSAFAAFLAENSTALMIIMVVIVVITSWTVAFYKTKSLNFDTSEASTSKRGRDDSRGLRVIEANDDLAAQPDEELPEPVRVVDDQPADPLAFESMQVQQDTSTTDDAVVRDGDDDAEAEEPVEGSKRRRKSSGSKHRRRSKGGSKGSRHSSSSRGSRKSRSSDESRSTGSGSGRKHRRRSHRKSSRTSAPTPE